MFRINSKDPRGHFRAGRFWPHEGIEVGNLSKEALAALEADPRIVVERQEAGLEAMTVEQLKALAAERGVDLGEAKKKAEIIEALTAAASAAPASENEGSSPPGDPQD